MGVRKCHLRLRVHHAQLRRVEKESLQFLHGRQEVLKLFLLLDEVLFLLFQLVTMDAFQSLGVHHNDTV